MFSYVWTLKILKGMKIYKKIYLLKNNRAKVTQDSNATHGSFFFSRYQMMCGLIQATSNIVQRSRVKASMLRVVPRSNRQMKAIRRRQSKVASPNSLWHIDGHMKLIR